MLISEFSLLTGLSEDIVASIQIAAAKLTHVTIAEIGQF